MARLLPFACALKAQNMTAQGNALGTNVHFVSSPERAAQVGFATAECSAPTGLDSILNGLTQGVALGCHIKGFQPFPLARRIQPF
jgi:hypothetical protein